MNQQQSDNTTVKGSGEVHVEMPARRAKNTRVSPDAQAKEQHDLRQKRYTLFIQQVEKEAQERLNELEAKMETMLVTVDKVFELEIMKMPLSLQNTRIGNLLSEEVSTSDVSIAVKNNSPEMHQRFKRVPSQTVRPYSPTLSHAQTLSGKTPKGAKASRKQSSRNGAGTMGGSAAVKRTRSHMPKSCENTERTRPKLRYVSSDISCLASSCGPHITITTSRGKISLSEETKDEINLDLFDDVALQHIRSLARLTEYLANKVGSE